LNCLIKQVSHAFASAIEQFNRKFAKMAFNPKDLHRTVTETAEELDDVFTWREPRRVTNSLTITYDKCVYLLENTEENQRLIGKYLEFLEYPDGTVAIMYEGRKINYSIFDKLSQLNQREIVENKWLGVFSIIFNNSMKNWNNKTNGITLKRCHVDVHRKQQFNNEI